MLYYKNKLMDYQSLKPLVRKYSLPVFIAIGAAIVAFFLFRYLTPFGLMVKYQFNSQQNIDKVSKIKGAQSTETFQPGQNGVLQIPQQVIRQNAATFNLKLVSKPIEGVWVNLRFKGNPKEIKIGVRGSEKEKYLYQPLYNQILESSDWNKIKGLGYFRGVFL